MYHKLSIFTIVIVTAFNLLSFLNFTAYAADCDSRFYLNGAQPTDSGSRQYDGFLLYSGKSPGTAETVCVTDRNNENQIRRYIVERILIGTTPITLTHDFRGISARAYPDTLDIDPTKRESKHVVARCASSSDQYNCDAYPDPMSMVKIRTYYSQNKPGKIEFTINAPRPEIRKAFKIDHAMSTRPAEMRFPNGKIIRFPFSASGGFQPAPSSEKLVYGFLQTAPDESVIKVSVPVILNNGQTSVMKTEVTIGQIKLASNISDLTGQVYAKRPVQNLSLK